MFRRVRIRITLLALAIVMCLYVVSSIAVYSIARQFVLRDVDARLLSTVHATDHGNIAHIVTTLPPGTWMEVHTAVGDITNLTPDVEPALDRWIARRPAGQAWRANWRPKAGMVWRVLYLPLGASGPDGGGPDGYIVIAIDIEREMEVLERLRLVLLLVGAGGLVAGGVAGFFLAERVLRPIREAWRRQLEFVADASHELRTPLAVIQSNLDVVLEHTNESVADNLEWIHNARGEARRLSKLVRDLLTLARGDAEAVPLSLQPVSTAELVDKVVELFDPVAAMRGLHLVSDCQPDAVVTGDPDRLHQLLVILVDNACKFTPEGGTVTLRTRRQKNTVLLEVSDTGIGIEEAHLKRIFDRFFQVDPARARDGSHGHGLGLSIARWIVEAHRGKISVSSRVGEGTTFTIQLPAAG
ncbi:ATP-binding protein [Alicyclobacillus sp.]|uniref:sensor histidine kinase n=1 Tax=Alicyclobacillus sp. TaxID=61169 RepID=UPI0025C4F5DE|nr:ATP-binding protein [Alicyclobacillus sp.]MCL6516300.1 HAMP domain-containing histidine kinase [Alicyclobacillus sp.]